MLEVDVQHSFPGFELAARFSTSTDGVTALFGPSGAGKSSVVNAIAGLSSPDRGRIALSDEVLFDRARGIDVAADRRRLGQVFQDARLFPHYSVRGNLLYGRRRQRAPAGSLDFDRVVELLDLRPLLDRRPRRLSGGERQRVALGRALLANPRMLLMDEPLASLDQPRRQAIMPFIERLRDEVGIPIVYVSHAVEEIVRLSDSVVALDQGRVAAAGSVDDVLARPDIRHLTAGYDPGVALPAMVVAHHPDDGLTELSLSGWRLFVPSTDFSIGTAVNARIRGDDVALATERPTASSFVNVLPGTVTEVQAQTGCEVGVRVNVANASIWSRITHRSRRALEIQPGRGVFALIKAVAIDRRLPGHHPDQSAAATAH